MLISHGSNIFMQLGCFFHKICMWFSRGFDVLCCFHTVWILFLHGSTLLSRDLYVVFMRFRYFYAAWKLFHAAQMQFWSCFHEDWMLAHVENCLTLLDVVFTQLEHCFHAIFSLFARCFNAAWTPFSCNFRRHSNTAWTSFSRDSSTV